METAWSPTAPRDVAVNHMCMGIDQIVVHNSLA